MARRHIELHSTYFHQVTPTLGRKLRITIREYLFRQAMKLEQIRKEAICNINGSIRFLQGNKLTRRNNRSTPCSDTIEAVLCVGD